jgi:hypothetical protein
VSQRGNTHRLPCSKHCSVALLCVPLCPCIFPDAIQHRGWPPKPALPSATVCMLPAAPAPLPLACVMSTRCASKQEYIVTTSELRPLGHKVMGPRHLVHHRMCPGPGIGELSALQLLAEVGPLGDRSARQWVTHAGLDVRHYSAGSSVRGLPHISKCVLATCPVHACSGWLRALTPACAPIINSCWPAANANVKLSQLSCVNCSMPFTACSAIINPTAETCFVPPSRWLHEP